MKQKLLITTSLMISFIFAFAMFAGIEGKWKGVLPLGSGRSYPLNYTFYTGGGKLTGFNQSGNDTTVVTEGKIYGDSISFIIDAMGTKMLHTGKYFPAGDSIGLTINMGGKIFQGTLKRSE